MRSACCVHVRGGGHPKAGLQGRGGCASCLEQMQSPGQKGRYRWSMPAPRTKEGAHLGQQAVLGQDAACLASGSRPAAPQWGTARGASKPPLT